MAGVSASNTSTSITLAEVLMLIVSLGTAFLLLRFLTQLASLVLQLKKMRMRKIDGCRIVEIDGPKIPSFSFFHWIVINTSNTNAMQERNIICHETAHVSQLHSVDVILYEIFCAIFWWNPFAWLLKNEMKLNLEYLADEVVQENTEDLKQYQYTLLQIITANTGVAFINNFNVSHLKKRITMMNTKRSSKRRLGKYVMVVPLVLALIFGNMACGTRKVSTNASANGKETRLTDETLAKWPVKDGIHMMVDQMPSFPGGEAEMMKFISNNLRYPIDAQRAGAEGRVTIRFVVNKKGEVVNLDPIHNNVKLKDGLDQVVLKNMNGEEEVISLEYARELLIEEAMRTIKAMPEWEPGKHRGKVVPVYFSIPILYRLR